MATSSFPSVVTGVTVETATNGALSGDGSSLNKLAVGVDGTTIDVNGDDQLEVIGATPIDATFVTATDETGTLTGSRQLVDGTNTTVDVSTPGQIKVNASGGGSLPLQVAADGDPVLLNHAGDTVLSVDVNGNPLIAANSDSNIGYFSGFGVFPGFIGHNGNALLFDAGSDSTTLGIQSYSSASAYNQFPLSLYPPLKVAGSGTAASLTTTLGVPNADLTWTQTGVGQQGNATQIAYVDPGLPSQSLSASYAAPVLTINLATDGGSAITTTASDIIALGSYDSAPVTVALADGSDGSGVVIALSATNLTGGLAALNVTGPSSLDNGAIQTDGSGVFHSPANGAAEGGEIYLNPAFSSTIAGYIGIFGGNTVLASGANVQTYGGSNDDFAQGQGGTVQLQAGSGLTGTAKGGNINIFSGNGVGGGTDGDINLNSQGGTINLNSPLTTNSGTAVTATATFTSLDGKTVTVTNGLITSVV